METDLEMKIEAVEDVKVLKVVAIVLNVRHDLWHLNPETRHWMNVTEM